jgi:hypothetical protein
MIDTPEPCRCRNLTISATLCLDTDAAGTARYFLANETTLQT